MNLKEITIKDFMSMEDVSIAFQDGIVSVTGKNNDVIGATSNGSGKSVLFDAIVWALYGKTIRPVGSDDIIRRGRDGAGVTIIFEKAGSTYCVERTRSAKANLQIFVSEGTQEPKDLTQGIPSLTQGKLDEIIGMDYKTFLSVATFDLDALRFARATDKEQKEILERLLNLDLYNVALEKTRKELSAKEKELAGLVSGREYLAADKAKLEAELKALEAKLGAYLIQLQNRHHDDAATIKQLEERIEGSKAWITSFDVDIENLRNAPVAVDNAAVKIHQTNIQLATDLIVKYEAEIKTLQGQLAKDAVVDPKLCQEYNDSRTKLKLADQELKSVIRNLELKERQLELVEKKLGTPCGECSRPITENELGGVIENYANEVLKLMEQKALTQSAYVNIEIWKEGIDEEYTRAYQAAVDENAAKGTITKKISALNAEIAARRAEISKAQGTITTLEHSAQKDINNRIIKLETDKSSHQQSLAGYEKQIVQIKHALELLMAQDGEQRRLIDNCAKRLDENIEKLKQAEAKANLVSDDAAYLKYWEKAFSYQGIRAVLLDDVAAKLTETANNYLKEMMGGTLWIDCHTQSTNKDGEKRERFEVQTFNSFGAGTYYGNSKGEQQRIDIALSLALHDIARTRSASPIGFTIFDEVFERLDEAGCDSIIRLLHKERTNFGTVFVVSHNPNLTIRFPKSIEFVKQNGITSLVKKEIPCAESKPESTKTEKTISPTRKGRPKKTSIPKEIA